MDRKHIIIDSSFGRLRLTDAEHSEFQREMRMLFQKYYLLERAAEGIWASNQGKYVKQRSQLLPWDDDFMEKAYLPHEPKT